MAEEQDKLPSFRNPPVMETVLGVQFAPIPDLTGGHIGWYWKSCLGSSWPRLIEGLFLQDQFERFEQQPSWNFPSLQFSVTVPNRLQIIHEDDDRVIQVQNTRFLYNWRRREDEYPRYRSIYPEFIRHLELFRAFLKTANLGDLVPNQWEVTYISHIPQGDLWKSPIDWCKVFPRLFTSANHSDSLRLESMANDWHFEITPQKGRLHISSKHGRVQDGGEDVLSLELTARGPLQSGDMKAIESGLDLGHRSIVQTFVALASESALNFWGIE